MSKFQGEAAQEVGADKDRDLYVEKLKAFLLEEATERFSGDGGEGESFDGNHAAVKASEAIDNEDFEVASTYLDTEIEKAREEIRVARDAGNQQRQAAWEIRQSDLEKLKAGLELQ